MDALSFMCCVSFINKNIVPFHETKPEIEAKLLFISYEVAGQHSYLMMLDVYLHPHYFTKTNLMLFSEYSQLETFHINSLTFNHLHLFWIDLGCLS